MYQIRHAQTYRKALKRLSKSGRKLDILKLEKVIDMLASDKILPVKYQNHYLSGHLSKYQECHIKNDLLLIYYKDDKNLILALLNIGSHQELFDK